jgi:serine protease Do
MKKSPLFWTLLATLAIGIAIGFSLKEDTIMASYAFESRVNETGSGEDIEPTGKAFARIAREVSSAVVTITSEKKSKIGGGFDEIFKNFHKNIPETGIGSGVIIRKEGYIVTNEHVIKESDVIKVHLNDKRILEAELVGSDPLTDIALIKIDADNLPVLKLGNSDDALVGEWVLAVGSPLSLNSTVTAGIVSAKGRQIGIIDDAYGVENFIQTDAVINPGNSGGALVNIKGELIGINTAIATKTGLYQGYGFAVPVNIARSVSESLIEYGQVVRGYIGVTIKDLDITYAKAVGLPSADGVLVEDLTANGAAREAGLKEGDVLLEIDGRPLAQRGDLQAYISTKKPGDRVKVSLFRSGSKMTKEVVLRSRDGQLTVPTLNSTQKAKKKSEEIGNGVGFEVKEMSGAEERGVEVVKVSRHARHQQIYEGMILTSIAGSPIASEEDFERVTRRLKDGDAVIVHLKTRSGDFNKVITAVEVVR